MILRWLHIIWKFLLRTITSVLIVTIVATLLLFALVQLPDSKTWLSDKIEQQFNQAYHGTLEIGEVTGLIPFRIGLTDVHVRNHPGDPTSVLSAERITANVRVWSLLQRTVDIRSLELDHPTLRLSTDQEGQPNLRRTFEKTDPTDDREQTGRSGSLFELMAPAITIRNGHIESAVGSEAAGSLSPLLPLRELDASVYLELSSTERFLDISYISGTSSDERLGSFFIAGQLFSDNEFLELNGFQVRTPSSELNFTAEATPVDLFGPNLEKQLREANFRFDLNESWIEGDAIDRLVEEWPFPESMVRVELLLEGSLETLYLDRFIGSVGNSSLLMTGQFNQLHSPDFNWIARLENLLLHRSELEQLFRDDPNIDSRTDYFSESRFYGQVGGTPDQLNGSLEVNTASGDFQLDGALQFSGPFQYEADAVLDSLDISPLFPGYLEQSLLDGRISLRGEGAGVEESQGQVNISLNEGELNRIRFNQGTLEAEWADQHLEHQLFIGDDQSSFRSTGSVGKRNNKWSLDLEGQTQNLDLNAFYPDLPRSIESLSMEYRSWLQWSSPDDLAGQLSVEMERLVMQPDTLQNHQFYVDINQPDETNGSRQLRLTSTFLDAEMEGDIYPVNLQKLYQHWHSYVSRHVQEDLLFSLSEDSNEAFTPGDDPGPAELSLSLQLKEFSLLRHYFPSLPDLSSNSSIRLNLDGSAEELLLTGSLQDNGLEAGPFFAERIAADLTANFRYDDHLRENSTFDLQIRSTEYGWNNLLFHEGFLNSSLENDQLMLSHNARNHENDFELDMTLISHLQPTEIGIELRNFMVGNEEINWRAEGTPRFRFLGDQSLHIDQLVLASEEESVELEGIYSVDPDEEMSYRIRSLQLDRLSELIGGRVRFGGRLNGDFKTRTLTSIPMIEGDLEITRGTLNNRLIGDLTLNSRYQSSRQRFDTEIRVHTDPQTYPDYYDRNDEVGQDLFLNGYFTVPDLDEPDREFFYFDADLREIDTWIATVIVPAILIETEGRTSGWGYIGGSLNDINFHAQFDIDDVELVPRFINTRYTANGRLVFDRHDGLSFDNIALSDGQGGSGQLSGTVDLDNFSDTNYMDLTLDLENLHFMNNPYTPDVPFYSSSRGTGQARITGSNFDPYLRTTRPIVITPGSRISVPLLDETELQQNQNFIQFVDTFDLKQLEDRRQQQEDEERDISPQELTFTERFTLDLQFIAENPVNFQLVFDRVTNEVLNANGTGQLRLTLEDQTFNLFGRMNISGGDYQFVAGDIISRRFQLNEGGSIIWEGDPANARLNVEALYRARPDLSSLLTSSSAGRIEGSQRIPIDLVLNIGGTLSELENDFYFQVPSNIEGTLDPTMLTQINSLNRNEEEKVIQATSLLLSGNFIPLASASTEGGTGSALRETLTGGAVVNPLITSQVINPLLSDQINSLLRSDMTLDIDFNLTPYNQVDLGVALRLYDDRLILRRDGQITGPYSDIGDLGATYRFNQTFALTAFHRQDPTLTYSSTTEPRQVQEMNGVGLEAQVQFNSWREFRQRISNTLRKLFGLNNRGREEEQTHIEDDREEILASDQ